MANTFTDVFGNEIDLNSPYSHDWDWNLPKIPSTTGQNPKTSITPMQQSKKMDTNSLILYVTLGLTLLLFLKKK